jgi:hypothetical protein
MSSPQLSYGWSCDRCDQSPKARARADLRRRKKRENVSNSISVFAVSFEILPIFARTILLFQIVYSVLRIPEKAQSKPTPMRAQTHLNSIKVHPHNHMFVFLHLHTFILVIEQTYADAKKGKPEFACARA